MRQSTRIILFALFILVLLVMVAPLFAQEATPEPTVAPTIPAVVTVTPASTEQPDSLAPLLVMAGAIFMVMEVTKTNILVPLQKRFDLSNDVYAGLCMAVACVLGLVLMFGAPSGLDLFTLTGYPNPFNDTFARIVTGLAVGAGNAFIHGAYNFLQAAKLVPIKYRN